MKTAYRPDVLVLSALRWLGVCLLATLAASGCSEEKKVAPSVSEPPVLQVIHPTPRKIVRVVGQPSFVQSYERTSIYPKLTAYIEKWNVDIGDRVRKGDVLADLFVPELREQWETKKAYVGYASERVRLAQENVEVAAADVEAARAKLKEAKAILAKYKAEVERWRVQVDRLARGPAAGRRASDPSGVAERAEGGHRRERGRRGDDREGGRRAPGR